MTFSRASGARKRPDRSVVIEQILQLLQEKGGRAYEGEGVSQLEHALQSAHLAERAGAPPELLCAALLHDIGHLLNDRGDTPTLRGVDDLHQYAALPFLRGLFPQAVLGPIGLHVDAKRYLCATRPGYREALSADSQRSLDLQGGVFSAAKVAGAATPGIGHFEATPRAVALR